MNSTDRDRIYSRLVGSCGSIALINIPFVLGHPALIPDEWPFVRSLAINLVLFWAPGWACCAPNTHQIRSPILVLSSVILVSFAVFLGVLGVFHVGGRPIDSGELWNVTWLLTNLMFLGRVLLFRHRIGPIRLPDKPLVVGIALFAASYYTYFEAATKVVPPQPDHDFEVQGTGWALLERMEPLLLTDRGTHYYFAHPPLLHYYVAASFLYYGQTEDLKLYDAASQRIRAARRGDDFVPFEVLGHRVEGRLQNDYVLETPENALVRIPIKQFEMELIEDHYAMHPHRLETRTPTIFLAALTVALLGCWITRLSGRSWWGLLAGACYATCPEVFVRSSYGGYFGISMFAVLCLLSASSSWENHRERGDFRACLLWGVFAAWSNHKLLLLPFALSLFQVSRHLRRRRKKGAGLVSAKHPSGRSGKRVLTPFPVTAWHPALIGFLVGTGLFWIYGLSISPGAFWEDHLRTHLLDRIAHVNPLGYVGYPTMIGLWKEFWENTGYVLLPVGCIALIACAFRGVPSGKNGISTATIRSWLVWVAVTAMIFTIVDWRMTKHLSVLILPLHLVIVVWAEKGHVYRWISCVAFVAALGWNLSILYRLVTDFSSFQVTPGW